MTAWDAIVVSWVPFGAVVAAFLLMGRFRALRAADPTTVDDRSVAVIIPARNEVVSLAGLLTDLVAAGTADPRRRRPAVYVVDDHSTDGTAQLARGFDGVTVLGAPPLPAGWCGKPWACHTGSAEAIAHGAEVLVFVDADVRLAPGAVDAVVAEQHRAGGVISVQPFHHVPTAVEQLSAPFNLVSMMAIGAGTDHPAALTGPLICCTTADYRRIDGHRSVRSSVTEDVALGKRFAAAGIGRRVLRGADLVRFRMYPTGFAALAEGWTKNMATGATAVRWWRSLGVGLWVTGMASASLSLRHLPGASAAAAMVLVAAYLLTAVSFGSLLRRLGDFRWWTWVAHPLVIVSFSALFVRSLWRTFIRRSVVWKGRSIELRAVDPEGVT